jgi:CxxH/CxxC protein (TIGR04129 family)
VQGNHFNPLFFICYDTIGKFHDDVVDKSFPQGGMRMIKCCEEHIDLAIDMYVDEYELAPEINKIEGNTDLSTSCEYCQNRAIYIVGN